MNLLINLYGDESFLSYGSRGAETEFGPPLQNSLGMKKISDRCRDLEYQSLPLGDMRAMAQSCRHVFLIGGLHACLHVRLYIYLPEDEDTTNSQRQRASRVARAINAKKSSQPARHQKGLKRKEKKRLALRLALRLQLQWMDGSRKFAHHHHHRHHQSLLLRLR